MNSRGQSALEYLMTYGWALIVIAIVVGTLLMIIQPTYSFRCSTNCDLIMRDYSFPDRYASGTQRLCGQFEIWDGNLVLQNATGQTMSIVGMTTEGYFGIVNIGDHTCWPAGFQDQFAPFEVTDVPFSESDPVVIKEGELFFLSPYKNESLRLCGGAMGIPLIDMPKWFLGRVENQLPLPPEQTCGSYTPYPGTDFGKINLTYRTETGLTKTTTITCNGWPEKLPN